MGISGNIKTMAPGDLLQWLSLAQKTGTLVVNNAGVEKKIFFERGRVISSASNEPRSYLGQFLMSHGFITEEELKKAMEVQAQTKTLLGKILVDIGTITEEDLLRLMRLKAEEEVYEVFIWKEGEFRFLDDELPQMQMVPLQIDVTGIIMEGARRLDEWSRIRELVPNKQMVPVIERHMEYGELPEAIRRIAQAINGHRTIEEIVLESRSSTFNVSRAVYEFVRDGYVKLIERVQPPPPVIEVEPEDEITALLVKAQQSLKTGDFEKALRILKAAQNLDPTNQKVTNALKGAETVIASELNKAGIVASKVPRLIMTFDDMSSMNFTPNEGFILSRINGMWDLGSIIKISPMREIDAMLIFNKLRQGGIIDFK